MTSAATGETRRIAQLCRIGEIGYHSLPMPGPAENFSVVIVGAMNPRIHHPYWYRQIEALTDAEVDAALTGPATSDFVVTTPASQFRTGQITIVCTLDRWEARSTTEDDMPRLVDIAVRALDTLDHTPVTAFGMNFDYQTQTGHADVGALLARRVHSLGLGVPANASSATLQWARTEVQQHSVLTLSSIVAPVGETDPGGVIVRNNHHHRIQIAGVVKFELAPLFAAAMPVARAASRAQLGEVLQALQNIARMPDGAS